MGRTKELSEETERKIIYNYVELKQGLGTVGRNFGVSQYMVEKTLKKYGIKKRTYAEAKQTGRKFPCNDNFFKVQNSNMAYILGLLAADGSVSKKENLIAIQLKAVDKEILEKINEKTQNTRPLEFYTRKETGHEISSFRVWSAEWKKDLAHYGITPNKTFTLQPPDFLLPEYRIDYIRGYFDGDGSIYQLKTQNRVFFEITGASKVMIDWIRNELVNHYHIFINKELIEHRPNGTVIYKIKIGSVEELNKLYTLLYKDKELFLTRKKEKFYSLLKLHETSIPTVEE